MNHGRLKTTGKLGSVMKESVAIAYTVARKFLFDYDATNNFFEKANIHIHFPEGTFFFLSIYPFIHLSIITYKI
jgi:ATP-dependent Lon protease